MDPDEQPRALTPITHRRRPRRRACPLLDERPTAVMCDDDIIAAGLYLAARERGLRIPKDLSVIGFDDMDFARVLEPPADDGRAGRRAAGRQRLRAAGAAHGGRRIRRRVVLPAELLVRGSTGRRRGQASRGGGRR